MDGLAGVRAGVSTSRVGVYGRVRPGFSSLVDRGVGCTGPVCPLALIARPVYHTAFALDVGGTVELTMSPRTLVRLDVGDLIVRERQPAGPGCQRCTTHNLLSRIGIGVRF